MKKLAINSRKMGGYSILFLFLSILPACQFLKNKISESIGKDDPGKLLAEVKEKKLYESDLVGLVPKGASESDSTAMVNRYLNAWIRKQLILNKAKTSVQIDEAEIQRKLLDYKYDLITYEFEKQYIERELDTTVKEEDVRSYYEENQANFELKQPIVQALLIKVPLSFSDTEAMKKLIFSKDPADRAKLKEYCVKFAPAYHLKDSVWVDFEGLIQSTPFTELENKVGYLSQHTFAEKVDDSYRYFLHLKDYKISNQASPLNYVRPRIVNMIINQRKVQLAKQLEQTIFDEGKKKQSFKLYTN